MNDIVILGGGGFARDVYWILDDFNQMDRKWNILGFIDENPTAHGQELCGLPVLGSFEWFARGCRPSVICGVGGNRTRRKFTSKARELGLEFACAIHPAARVSRHVEIGQGCVICAGTAIPTRISLGDHVNLNLNCTVGDDVVIESYCNLSSGVHISGHAHLETGLDIGPGARVIPSVRIGRDSIIATPDPQTLQTVSTLIILKAQVLAYAEVFLIASSIMSLGVVAALFLREPKRHATPASVTPMH
jgi:sugar O-acyltransferase (sialic acid O-acetyltransferase NeuD family)